MNVELNTRVSVSVHHEGEPSVHELYALLDWTFGELTMHQTMDYAKVAKYPESLEAAFNGINKDET